jgi:hypothetical protein
MADDTPQPAYSPPLDKLLSYGDCREIPDWPDYLELGFTQEHVPELIRMAGDDALDESDDDLLFFAPIHAWRVLGQLRAEEAIRPLIDLFKKRGAKDDDWFLSDLPKAVGMIGPAAIPALVEYMADDSHGLFPRVAAINSLQEMAECHADARDRCAAALAARLENFEHEEDVEFNAFLVAALVDLKAREFIGVIREAYKAEAVLEGIIRWKNVRGEFNLEPREDDPISEFDEAHAQGGLPESLDNGYRDSSFPDPYPSIPTRTVTARKKAKKRKKAKRRQAERSRKRNRKR